MQAALAERPSSRLRDLEQENMWGDSMQAAASLASACRS